MNIFLRFLLAYIIIIVSIVALYMNVTKEYKNRIVLTQSELAGVEYLKGIYHLSLSTAIYTGVLGTEDDAIKLSLIRKNMLDDINAIYQLRDKHPQFQNETLHKYLKKIETSKLTEEDLYEFLDYLNHENYAAGDISKLLFEKDRKLYFLASLTTHYMPEFLISLHTVNNIINKFEEKGALSTFEKRLYTEQNKLVELSTEELSGIIKLLNPYEDTKELSSLMSQINVKLEHLSHEMTSLPALNQVQHKTKDHLHTYSELLALSHKLNNEYMILLESNLHNREAMYEEKVFYSNLILSLAILIISMVTHYWYRGVMNSIKKDIEIKNINDILDKHVIFSKTDENGIITYVSTALVELSGYSRDELLGLTHTVFKHPDNKRETFDGMWKTITSKKIWSGELKNRKKDGTSYWLRLTITPELDADGEIVGYSAYREDISNQKALESEKIKTQEALEFKSMFLSNMSHEIRTPLNGIVGFTHMALKTDLDDKQKDLLQKISTTSDVLLNVINDILDISKIEAGKMPIEKIKFDLKRSIQHIEELLQDKAKEKNITLSVDYDHMKNFNLLGDPLRISQVLTNLLNNAIKFTQMGKVILRVIDLGSDIVRFEVEDTGIGLKENQMKLLFQSFSQADMSTSRKFGGTGLGLAISKNLVEMMGGTISAKSDFGVGSTFSFELPLPATEPNTLEDQSDTSSHYDEIEAEVNAIKGAKVLVAEDNKMNQMLLEMLLEESSLTLDFAQDGQVALDRFKQNDYDMVLMDIQMPYMNGYQATEQIRMIDAQIPIIALSANVMEEDIQKAYDAGMDDYLAKPIDNVRLYEVLLKYLKK